VIEPKIAYGENSYDEAVAAAWAEAAARKCPWRPVIFDHAGRCCALEYLVRVWFGADIGEMRRYLDDVPPPQLNPIHRADQLQRSAST
jgi:hypothetical protein